MSKQPRICINRHEAYELLSACALDKSMMPLIDMLIQSNKSQSDTIKTLKADNAKLNRALDVAAETLNHIACGCPKDECDTCVVSGDCTHKTVMNYADCWREYALAEQWGRK